MNSWKKKQKVASAENKLVLLLSNIIKLFCYILCRRKCVIKSPVGSRKGGETRICVEITKWDFFFNF